MGRTSAFSCIPQNDLDCYYNSEWKNKQNLTARQTVINNFYIIQEGIDKELEKFITNIAYNSNPISQKLYLFRESYYHRTDTPSLISNLIKSISKITNLSELATNISIIDSIGIDHLFTINVVCHHRTPDIYTILIGEISLTFDSKEFYNDVGQSSVIGLFETVLADIYQFISEKWTYDLSDKKTFIQNIITCELLFSKLVFDLEDSQNPELICNSNTYQEFLKLYDVNEFWKTILDKHFDNHQYISYHNPGYLNFLKNFLSGLDIATMNMVKDYLIFCVVKKYGLYTSISKSLAKLSLTYLNTDKIFIGTFINTFGHYLEMLYEAKYADENKSEQIRDIFGSLKLYCINFFNNTSMFSESTRTEALKKLHKLDIIIGKQECPMDLTKLPRLNEDFYHNLVLLDSFYFKKSMDFINKPINRALISPNHDMYSFIVNAYYDPHTNIIYIPSSITHDIFYKKDADPIYNYGGLGSIIAHEMMHCFDNHGSQYDHLGHVRNWWTKEDHQKFNKEIEKINKHYASLAMDNVKINALASTGENMADIAGLKLSLRTFINKYSTNNYSKSNFDGRFYFSQQEKIYLQLFFARWAQIFRAVFKQKFLSHITKIDVHSPSSIRINAPFSHLNEYYEIFDVKPEHFNYLKNQDRTTFMDI